MFRLKMLGGLSLQSAAGPVTGPAAQRRRLALLAALALAGNRGMSRDKLLGLFWAESDEERARRVLAQTLYALRRELSAEDLFTGTTELRLNDTIVSADVRDFDAAVTAGRFAEAVVLYDGPLLDGFHISDAQEFSHLVDGERARLARGYGEALEALAAAAGSEGDMAACVEWWRRRAGADPLDARVAAGYLQALVANGDRTGALRHARVYETLVRQELGVGPDPSIVALVHRFTADDARPSAPPPNEASAPDAGAPPYVHASSHPSRDRKPASRRLRRYRHRPRWAIAAGIALAGTLGAMLGAAAFAARDKAPDAEPGAPAMRVAVLPFAVHGTSAIAYLRDGMVDLLSVELDGVDGLRAVDPHAVLSSVTQRGGAAHSPGQARAIAARFGAGLYVLGDVTEAGSTLRVSASLYDRTRSAEPVTTETVEGNATELFALVDRLAMRLLASRLTPSAFRPASAAATASLPALKRYLEGEYQMRRGHFADAVEQFRQAVDTDSTFALAYFRLAVAADWAGQTPLQATAVRAAERYRARLAPSDAALLDAYTAYASANADAAEAGYRAIVAQRPDNIEAWFMLGEVLYHHNAERGRTPDEARGPFERALALDPMSAEALIHLTRLAARRGDAVAVDSLARRAITAAPARTFALQMRALRAAALDDHAAFDSVLADLATAPDVLAYTVAQTLATDAQDLERAERAAQVLASHAQAKLWRIRGREMVLAYEIAQGRIAPALRAFEAPATDTTVYVQPGLAVLTRLPRRELTALRRLTARDAADGARAYFNRLMLATDAALALGDAASAQRLVDEEAAWVASTPPDSLPRNAPQLLAALRISVATAQGEASAALARFWIRPTWPDQGHLRFARAEALRATGRNDEALRWYRSFPGPADIDVVDLAPALLRRAEAAERAGDHRAARAAYTRFARLWRRCDPALRPLVVEAKRRAARSAGPSSAARGAHPGGDPRVGQRPALGEP